MFTIIYTLATAIIAYIDSENFSYIQTSFKIILFLVILKELYFSIVWSRVPNNKLEGPVEQKRLYSAYFHRKERENTTNQVLHLAFSYSLIGILAKCLTLILLILTKF